MTKLENIALSDLFKMYNYSQYISFKIERHYDESDRLKNELYMVESEIEELIEEKNTLNKMIERRIYSFLNKNGIKIIAPDNIKDINFNTKYYSFLSKLKELSNN